VERWYPGKGLTEQQQQRILEKKTRLDGLRPFPISAIKRLQQDIAVEWTYNSNSIEGNALSLRETRVVLQDGLTIGGKTLREHFEAINHHNAIAWLEDIVSPGYLISASDILMLHKMVMKSIDDEFGGRFRTGRVQITGANFIPPNPLKVPDLLDELLEWVRCNPGNLDPVSLAAVFHHRFVWIHPFFDGNGRTGRLAMNLILMSMGFPPVIILRADRNKYYRALNEANQGKLEKLMLLFFQGSERSLELYLSALGNGYDDYLPLAQIANDPTVPYGQEYLSLLARRGELEAFKEGRVWYSTQKAVKRYMKG
jgi:Fic family protein